MLDVLSHWFVLMTGGFLLGLYFGYREGEEVGQEKGYQKGWRAARKLFKGRGSLAIDPEEKGEE